MFEFFLFFFVDILFRLEEKELFQCPIIDIRGYDLYAILKCIILGEKFLDILLIELIITHFGHNSTILLGGA